MSSQGLTLEFGDVKKYFNWIQFKQISSDDQMYYIYLSDTNAFPIKKSPDNMTEEEISMYNSLLKKFIDHLGVKGADRI